MKKSKQQTTPDIQRLAVKYIVLSFDDITLVIWEKVNRVDIV